MKRTSFRSMACPIAQTLDVVGDPWTLLIVREAFFGTRRFDDFRKHLEIPRATLSARLGMLVEHGILDRNAPPDTPARPDYELTAKGRSLGPVMVAMLQWGDEWSPLPEPPVTLIDADTDEPIEPTYVDQRSGRHLAEIRIGRRVNRIEHDAAAETSTPLR